MYLERREAAAAILKKEPKARYRTLQNEKPGNYQMLRHISAPPTEEETEALKGALKIDVERWRELQSLPTIDTEDLRDNFHDACRESWQAMVAAWEAWICGLVDTIAVNAERAHLEDWLCIRVPRYAGSREWNRPIVPVPGDPISRNRPGMDNFPNWSQEIAGVFGIVPDPPKGSGSRWKAGKR